MAFPLPPPRSWSTSRTTWPIPRRGHIPRVQPLGRADPRGGRRVVRPFAALGLAEIAMLTLTYVELAPLTEHTVKLPVSVNVVPFDVAQRRVAKPEVAWERLFLETQTAKRDVETSLRDGDVEGARAKLSAVSARLSSEDAATLDAQLREEVEWLGQTEQLLDVEGADYLSKRLSSDRSRKSRGYKSRRQGGEI